MPSAQGLYHKAIVMSGTILNVNNKQMTEELGLAVLDELGIPHSEPDRIKDVPYDRLYQAGQRALSAKGLVRTPGTPIMWGFGPVPKSFPQKSKRGWNFPHPLISVVFLLLKCDDILQAFTCYLY